jgi:hypothetical protein
MRLVEGCLSSLLVSMPMYLAALSNVLGQAFQPVGVEKEKKCFHTPSLGSVGLEGHRSS